MVERVSATTSRLHIIRCYYKSAIQYTVLEEACKTIPLNTISVILTKVKFKDQCKRFRFRFLKFSVNRSGFSVHLCACCGALTKKGK